MSCFLFRLKKLVSSQNIVCEDFLNTTLLEYKQTNKLRWKEKRGKKEQSCNLYIMDFEEWLLNAFIREKKELKARGKYGIFVGNVAF